VGGTLTKAAVVDLGGRCVAELSRPTAASIRPDEVPGHVAGLIDEMAARASVARSEIAGACVGVPGVVNHVTGLVVSCPNLLNWEGMVLASLVEPLVQLPVVLEKDANLAALGERWLGAARGVDYCICFTIGTGIGTGIILGGQLYHGALGGAGEIGHLTLLPDGPVCGCGNHGCLEAMASARAIVRDAQAMLAREPGSLLMELAGGRPESITAEMVLAAARAGDPGACRVVEPALDFLGIGVTNVVNVFNPDLVVLGGGVVLAGDQVLEPVRQVVRRRARRLLADHVRIVPAELGSMAGVYGGAYLVFNREGLV
jgi:glucokinase